MALITDNTQIKLISGLSQTTDLFNSDLLLLQRGFKSYKFTYEDFVSDISDLITVNDNSVDTPQLVNGSVTSAKIANQTIVNEDVAPNAAIAGTKILPEFGSQNIRCTGNISTFGDFNGLGVYTRGDMWIDAGTPRLIIRDTSGISIGDPLSSSPYSTVEGNDGNLILKADAANNQSNSEIIFTIDNSTIADFRNDGIEFFDTVEANSGSSNIAFLGRGDMWIIDETPTLRYRDSTGGLSSDASIAYNNNTLSFATDLLSSTSASDIEFLTRGTLNLRLSSDGTSEFFGFVAKPSGGFKIDHPLTPNEKYLIHSFVEAPQADNIYRGVVTLSSGMATINIDTECRMSEGTFEVLNTNTQCFLNNESGWSQVRGSISGNILTIEAKESDSTDTISWMVIGERQDDHVINANWTDDQGRLITEPLK